VKGLLKSV